METLLIGLATGLALSMLCCALIVRVGLKPIIRSLDRIENKLEHDCKRRPNGCSNR